MAVPVFGVVLGVAAVFALLAGSDDESSQESSPRSEQPKAQPPIEDPLPEYALSQRNISEAITAFAESGEELKMKACLAKSVAPGASPALRAYFVAALSAIPKQLKADLDFIADFTKSDKEVRARIAAETKRNEAVIRVAESTITAVAGAINAVAGAVAVAVVALFEAGRQITLLAVGDLPRREAKDQIYQLSEGPTVRRGILFQPDLPYITKGERDLSDAVRSRWISESSADRWFLALPEIPTGTTFRFAPRWDDFANAVQQLKAKGHELGEKQP